MHETHQSFRIYSVVIAISIFRTYTHLEKKTWQAKASFVYLNSEDGNALLLYGFRIW